MGFAAHSPKAFCKARRFVLDGVLPDTPISKLPLWHNVIFRNIDNLTYYCPHVIKKSIRTIAVFFFGSQYGPSARHAPTDWAHMAPCLPKLCFFFAKNKCLLFFFNKQFSVQSDTESQLRDSS